MSNIEHLLPYIRLLKTGELAGTKTTEHDVGKCVRLRWADRSRRKHHCTITDLGREKIPEFLKNQWPEWESYYEELVSAGFEATIEGIHGFEQQRKMLGIRLPTRIHHKTLASCVGRHSKAGISQRLLNATNTSVITTDQILRIRANRGLVIENPKTGLLDCDQLMSVMGEVAIPERAFLDGIVVSGKMPKVIFTAENRGAYVDFPQVSPDILLIHAPGDDIALTINLLNLLPGNIPYYHFGDIDPKGLKIVQSIRKHVPQAIQLFIPKFWVDYIGETFTGTKQWPDRGVVETDSEVVRVLRREKKWLEQERIMLDPRLRTEIDNLVRTT